MRSTGVALSYAVLASALVLPDFGSPNQSPLMKFLSGDDDTEESPATTAATIDGNNDNANDGTERSWWDNLPTTHSVASALGGAADHLSAAIDNAVHTVEDATSKLHDDMVQSLDKKGDQYPDQTIYQLISENKHTTKFAEIVDGYPDLVKMLNSTKTNHTLFVPINKAFKDIPEDHEKPSKEYIEDLLYYHVGIGNLPVRKILSSYTLPTALDEKLLGGEPQRLRSSIGLGGIKLNFYSKVIKTNIEAKNGIIHAVNNILIPPPYAGQELALFPGKFSTLLLAYDKTNFVDFIHGVHMTGTTIFAPSNKAFKRLGPKANAFLFNTKTGLKYLKALLKYQIVNNATLYSDAFYDNTGEKDSEVDGLKREHYDLPTLLGDARVSVDIARWGSFASMRVNGFAHVSFQDAVAKNGVVQVVDRLPIPQCKHKKCTSDEKNDKVDVEDLKMRLEEYVDLE